MDDDTDFEDILASLQEGEEATKYGRSAVLLCTGWDQFTPIAIIYAGLSRVYRANWNEENVHLVNYKEETKIFVQESTGDINKFRAAISSDYKFISISGEKIYKVAVVFYRLDRKPLTSHDQDSALRATGLKFPAMKDYLAIHKGWSDRFTSINISHPDPLKITSIMEDSAAKYAEKADSIAAAHLMGHVYRNTFWTNDTNFKQYVFGPVGTNRSYHLGHEKGMNQLGKGHMMVYAPRLSIIQRLPQLTYFVWLDQVGYERFQRVEGRALSFYNDRFNKKVLATIRPFEKRARVDSNDNQAAFQPAHTISYRD